MKIDLLVHKRSSRQRIPKDSPRSSFRRRPKELFNSAAGHRFGFRNGNIDDQLRSGEAIPAFAGMTTEKKQAIQSSLNKARTCIAAVDCYHPSHSASLLPNRDDP